MNDPLRRHFLSMMLPHQRQKNGTPFGSKAVICRCGVRVSQDGEEKATACPRCGFVWRWEDEPRRG